MQCFFWRNNIYRPNAWMEGHALICNIYLLTSSQTICRRIYFGIIPHEDTTEGSIECNARSGVQPRERAGRIQAPRPKLAAMYTWSGMLKSWNDIDSRPTTKCSPFPMLWSRTEWRRKTWKYQTAYLPMQEWCNRSRTHSCLSEMEEYTEKSKNICM